MAASGMNVYKEKRVMVTGGTGFLGKVVVRKLNELGAWVWSPSSRELNLFYPVSPSHYEHKRPDLIIHLAAKVSGITYNRRHPFDYFHDNSLMANNIVDLAHRMSIPIVAAGSVCVYSDSAPLPFSEKDIFLGQPEISNIGYGLAKRHLLHLLLCAGLQDPLFRYAYVNSANLYGPGDNFGSDSHVIPALIRKVATAHLNGNQVRVFGTGRATRDFLHVEDAANAYVMAGVHLLEEEDSLICNVGSGTEVSIADVLSMICDIFEVQPTIAYNADNGDGQRRRLVNSQVAFRELGWRPYKELRQGLEETVEWYKTQYVSGTLTPTVESPENHP